ncbi:hypothetical protein [Benzoatithermus flavus]|uniref:Uncharacterized protein n=1 Tax=Benzoatithermus flavus TaxID=3108223 RepID=A0ABU8XR02_9PROT
MDAIDAQEAFRRGIRGVAFAPTVAFSSLAEIEAAFTGGVNETLLLTLTRLPGLVEPRAAYETGRALRMIIRLFDQAGAPEAVGRQFIDNLGLAVMAAHMRGSRPWGAADTVEMFIEMYSRVLGGRPSELERVRRTVMDYAVAEPKRVPRAGGGLVGMLRRRRTAGAG